MADDDFIPRAMRSCFSSRELERMTEFFDKNFDGLNLKDLPEYRTVVNAMGAYAEAVASRYVTAKAQNQGGEK